MAISLVAASNKYIQATGYKGILGTNPRSCAAWIKTIAELGAIFSWGINVSGQKWVFRMAAGVLRAEVNGGGIDGTAAINDGAWHHVAVTWEDDGSPNIEDALLFVDGQLDTISATLARAINTTSDDDVKVGVRGPNGNDNSFDGLIEDSRIYNIALSAREVTEIFAAKGLDMNMRILPSLEMRYPFRGQDGITAGTVKDFSVNARDGTPVNAPVYAPGFARLVRVY